MSDIKGKNSPNSQIPNTWRPKGERLARDNTKPTDPDDREPTTSFAVQCVALIETHSPQFWLQTFTLGVW